MSVAVAAPVPVAVLDAELSLVFTSVNVFESVAVFAPVAVAVPLAVAPFWVPVPVALAVFAPVALAVLCPWRRSWLG